MKALSLIGLMVLSLLGGYGTLAMAGTKVELLTSKGRIVVELNQEKAPLTVKNFLRYVDEGYYDKTLFHRVIKGFMIQGGGFDTRFQRKQPHASVANESSNGLKNRRGSIAMARTQDPNSAQAQFFINQVDNSNLDYPRYGGYTVFGQVVQGLEVVDSIASEPTATRNGLRDVPSQDVVLQRVQLLKAK